MWVKYGKLNSLKLLTNKGKINVGQNKVKKMTDKNTKLNVSET